MTDKVKIDEMRKWLSLIEDSVPRFNTTASLGLTRVGLSGKDILEMIPDWRWVISHRHFKKDMRQPGENCIMPSLNEMHAHLKGKTVPLEVNIARATSPYVESAIWSAQAPLMINQTLSQLYGCPDPEIARKERETQNPKGVKKRALQTRRNLTAKRKNAPKEPKVFTEEEQKKNAAAYLKKKNKQRAEIKKRREQAKKDTLRRFEEETKRLKKRGKNSS